MLTDIPNWEEEGVSSGIIEGLLRTSTLSEESKQEIESLTYDGMSRMLRDMITQYLYDNQMDAGYRPQGVKNTLDYLENKD